MLTLNLPIGQVSSVSLIRITPNDVLNGGLICPNSYPVEFTCIGIEVSFLLWQRNRTSLGAFTGSSSEDDFQREGPFTLFLDSIATRANVANMTSRLAVNISNLISGDRIICVGAGSTNTNDTVILNYSLRGTCL